jgi:hypothetical protein
MPPRAITHLPVRIWTSAMGSAGSNDNQRFWVDGPRAICPPYTAATHHTARSSAHPRFPRLLPVLCCSQSDRATDHDRKRSSTTPRDCSARFVAPKERALTLATCRSWSSIRASHSASWTISSPKPPRIADGTAQFDGLMPVRNGSASRITRTFSASVGPLIHPQRIIYGAHCPAVVCRPEDSPRVLSLAANRA